MKAYVSATLGLIAALLCSTASALPLNGTGLVTPDVIFGSGNANGSWTGFNSIVVELGLRGKLRYNLNGAPENTFNYDGNRTYTFDPANSVAPSNRSIFNFEFSINSAPTSGFSRTLDGFTYQLNIDIDPSAAIVNGFSGDPINVGFADHSFGTNSTANGAGVEATSAANYTSLLATNNVAQNSWNLGFGFTPNDPQLPGIYTISLSALSFNQVVGITSIDVVIGAPATVPVPATIPLLMAGLALLAFSRRRS